MKAHIRLACAAAMALAAASPATAWKLVNPGDQVIIGKTTMVVVPTSGWNRSNTGYVVGSDVWTIDGTGLNELYFAADISNGKPLLYEFNKKDNPLPKFAETMQLTDLPDLLERTWRVGRKAVVYKTVAVEPARLGGHDAVRIRYEYVLDGNHLTYKGVATAAIVSGKLQLAVFEAPALYYYDRDRAKAEAAMDGVTFRALPIINR